MAGHPSPRTPPTPRTLCQTMALTKEERTRQLCLEQRELLGWSPAEIKLPQAPRRANAISRAPKGQICSPLPPGWRRGTLASHFTSKTLPAFAEGVLSHHTLSWSTSRAISSPFWGALVIVTLTPRSREGGVSTSDYTGEKEDPGLPNDSL